MNPTIGKSLRESHYGTNMLVVAESENVEISKLCHKIIAPEKIEMKIRSVRRILYSQSARKPNGTCFGYTTDQFNFPQIDSAEPCAHSQTHIHGLQIPHLADGQ